MADFTSNGPVNSAIIRINDEVSLFIVINDDHDEVLVVLTDADGTVTTGTASLS